MPDVEDVLQFTKHIIPGRFASWLNYPDIRFPCPDGTIGDCTVAQWTTGYELRKMTASFTRAVGVTPPQDAAMCTFHFLNLTADAPDATWTTADFTTVESAFDAFWTAIKNKFPTTTKLTEISWRKDGPLFRPHGTDLSPTVRVVSRAVAGGSVTDMLPPQAAISVTEVTAAKFTVEDVEGVGTQTRNRWGRFYLPAPTTEALIAGRILDGTCTQIANAVQTFYNACVTADLIPVMYSPTTGNSWTVDEIHVDDIFDVIRSRRYEVPTSRHSVAITAP